MNDPSREVWFPAKRYGWGWGLPVAWQGWVVLLAYGVLLGSAGQRFPPSRQPVAFAALAVAATLGLLIVCWLKGERPDRGGH